MYRQMMYTYKIKEFPLILSHMGPGLWSKRKDIVSWDSLKEHKYFRDRSEINVFGFSVSSFNREKRDTH